jgi:hypothetical protein
VQRGGKVGGRECGVMDSRRRNFRFSSQDLDCMGEYHRMLVALRENNISRRLSIEEVTTSGSQNRRSHAADQHCCQ